MIVNVFAVCGPRRVPVRERHPSGWADPNDGAAAAAATTAAAAAAGDKARISSTGGGPRAPTATHTTAPNTGAATQDCRPGWAVSSRTRHKEGALPDAERAAVP